MSPEPAWDGRSYGGDLGHRIFIATIRFLGAWPTYALLALVVPYYCLIARKAVRAARSYHARVLGPAWWPRRVLRTYRHFFEFGQVLVDRFIFYAWGPRSFDMSASGWEHIEAARARGKGVILLSAHVGGWEMATGIRRRFETHQLGERLNIVMYLPAGEKAPTFVSLLEREGDVKVIPVDGTALPVEIIAALERGEVVAFHGDRAIAGATVRVPFLGSEAAFPAGPWQIAAATGAPVVPGFLLKTGFRRYRFETHPPFCVRAERRERARVLAGHVARYAAILEGILATRPYQWFNFFDFWA